VNKIIDRQSHTGFFIIVLIVVSSFIIYFVLYFLLLSKLKLVLKIDCL
jgi:hypothetical protein